MKYIGEFRNIADEAIRMVLTTDGSGTTNVEFADEPIVLAIDGGETHMYKAARYSNAVIRIFSKDYNFDLYAKTAQQNKVIISRNGATIWTGYLTSNLYNAGYEKEEEIIELEAIDALSTLQYYKYTPISGNKSIVSIADIIKKLLTQCNAYNEYFISDCTQISSSANECIIDKLFISEQNFFDEDDEAMTMQEVLEEICQYLGLCCCAFGDKVYFIDYDALKKEINTYYEFAITGSTPRKVTISHSKDIRAKDYAENGGQLSLDNVYNKVSVKDSLYSFDSIITSIWDDEYLTNYKGSGYVQEVNEEFKKDKYKCFFKYYKHKNYKSYYYDKSTLREVAAPSVMDYAATQNYVGATICRHYSEKVTDYNQDFNDIGFQDYVLIHCHNTTNVDDTVKRKMFSLEINDSKVSFLGGNTYLIVKGSFRYMDREGEMYIIDGYMNKDDNFDPKRLFIWARLQYGNQYWNGSTWTTTPSDFKLYYDSNGQTDHCINQVFQVRNNINHRMGLEGEEGYSIPMPSTTEVVVGKPTFTLYQPYKLDNSYRCDAVWLSDFDIVAKVQNFDSDADKDSDTEYSNVINEDYINELDDIEMKICTWDNKEANYSAVAYNNNGRYVYLDKVYNKATQQLVRLEEHCIFRLVTQYTEPSAKLILNLHDEYTPYSTVTDRHLPGRKFIVDSQEINLRDKKTTITLLEKK